MIRISVRVDLDDALRKLLAFDVAAMRRTVATAVAAEVQDRIAVYPPAPGRPQPFVSDKQRRFFFAALRDGRISVPYRRGGDPRSETLGRKWEIIPQPNGALLKNASSYSDLVHGTTKQTRYHRDSGWRTEKTAVTLVEQDGSVARIAEQVVKTALAQAGLT